MLKELAHELGGLHPSSYSVDIRPKREAVRRSVINDEDSISLLMGIGAEKIWNIYKPEFPDSKTVDEQLFHDVRRSIIKHCEFWYGHPYPSQFLEHKIGERGVGNCISFVNQSAVILDHLDIPNIAVNLGSRHLVQVCLFNDKPYYFDTRGEEDQNYFFPLTDEMFSESDALRQINAVFADKKRGSAELHFDLNKLPEDVPFSDERIAGEPLLFAESRQLITGEILKTKAYKKFTEGKLDDAQDLCSFVKKGVYGQGFVDSIEGSILFTKGDEEGSIPYFERAKDRYPVYGAYSILYLIKAHIKLGEKQIAREYALDLINGRTNIKASEKEREEAAALLGQLS